MKRPFPSWMSFKFMLYLRSFEILMLVVLTHCTLSLLSLSLSRRSRSETEVCFSHFPHRFRGKPQQALQCPPRPPQSSNASLSGLVVRSLGYASPCFCRSLLLPKSWEMMEVRKELANTAYSFLYFRSRLGELYKRAGPSIHPGSCSSGNNLIRYKI